MNIAVQVLLELVHLGGDSPFGEKLFLGVDFILNFRERCILALLRRQIAVAEAQLRAL